MSDRETNLLASVTQISWRFYLWIGGLSAIVLWGFYAHLTQARQGLIVTGMRDEIAWGLNITNFIFFVGISKGGTLISAVLRLSHAEWRRPITRLAEAMTVIALCIAGGVIISDLGRPERMLYLYRYARIQSPITWDILGLTVYFIASVVYLYLPLIPDLATLASQPGLAGWRRRLYSKLSVGWTGSAEQCQLLERAITIMAVVVISVAVSVHTILAWVFAMTLRPGWNSAVFGPLFVMGALYSGCAVVLIFMYALRRIFRLEDYLGLIHFRNLGTLLLVFSMLFLYLNINEYLTMAYKFAGSERGLLVRLFSGDFASYFWTSELLAKPVPILLLAAVLLTKRWRQYIIPGTVLASVFVVISLWLERFIIVVPTLSTPLLPMQGIPEEWMHYDPTWVEWSTTASAFAAFVLIYSLQSKLFPLVSIWETREAETVPTSEERAVPAVRPQPSLPRSLSVLLIGCLLTLAASSAYAQEPPPGKPRKATVLSLQHQSLPPGKPLPAGPEGGKSESGPITNGGENLFPPLALNVSLQDEEGKPLGFQVVRFILKTSFGTELEFGGRPTDAEGKAQLVITDRRCGKHLVKATYLGNETNAPASAEATADFGPCPPSALPDQGILITPYPTPDITLPFVGFYGLALAGVIYSLGYLVLWRIPRSGKSGEEHVSLRGGGTGPGGATVL